MIQDLLPKNRARYKMILNWIHRKIKESNMSKAAGYTCPVCGYRGLKGNPYKNMPAISETLYAARPPYREIWGMPTYEVCQCCGFEFGNDDDSGLGSEHNSSFSEYLEEWIVEQNCYWLIPEDKPADWDLLTQLKASSIPVSDRILALITKK